MMRSIIETYLANKISYRLGWFSSNLLEGIEKALVHEITGREFIRAFIAYRIFPPKILAAIGLASVPTTAMKWLQLQVTQPRIGWTPNCG